MKKHEKNMLLRGGEWLLYLVMIASFLHMADIAYDAQVQYQQMADYAEASNMSVVDVAYYVNLSVYPRSDGVGRSVRGRLTEEGLGTVGYSYNRTPRSYIKVYNCSCD